MISILGYAVKDDTRHYLYELRLDLGCTPSQGLDIEFDEELVVTVEDVTLVMHGPTPHFRVGCKTDTVDPETFDNLERILKAFTWERYIL